MAPQALGALVRKYGHVDLAEDAVQEALLAASTKWRTEGLPDNPAGWLTTVAARRLTDGLTSATAAVTSVTFTTTGGLTTQMPAGY